MRLTESHYITESESVRAVFITYIFFFKKMEDVSPFCGATDILKQHRSNKIKTIHWNNGLTKERSLYFSDIKTTYSSNGLTEERSL